MTTSAPAAKSVYRLPLMQRLFMAFVVSLACFFPLAIGAYLLTHNEFMMFALLAIVHTIIFVVFFRIGSLVSLSISPTGIEYRSPVHRVRSTWDNVDGIARVGAWTKPVQGLRLRQ